MDRVRLLCSPRELGKPKIKYADLADAALDAFEKEHEHGSTAVTSRRRSVAEERILIALRELAHRFLETDPEILDGIAKIIGVTPGDLKSLGRS